MSLISRTRKGLQNILQQTQTTGKESVQLARACWAASSSSSLRHRGTSAAGGGGDYKTALLQQAQQHGNRTAIRLLLLEKEYGLLRYHGLSSYLQQTAWWNRRRQQILRMLPSFLSLASNGSSNSSSSSSKNTISTGHGDDKDDGLEKQSSSNCSRDGDNTNNNNGVAKVAFMVTGRMKSELVESLGYDDSLIRSMTPVEASLVLEHRISPNDYSERIPVLRKEQEEAVALEAAEQQALLRQREEEEKETQFATLRQENIGSSSSGSGCEQGIRDGMGQSTLFEGTDNPQKTTNNVSLPSFELSLPQMDSVSSRQDDHERTQTADSVTTKSILSVNVENNKGTTWYELVQTSNNEEESVVGLYRTQEEATFGREVHEELAQGRAKRGDKDAESWSFQIRATVR